MRSSGALMCVWLRLSGNLADILVPDLLADGASDPVGHHLGDLGVLEVDDLDALGAEELFTAEEVLVLSQYNEGELVQNASTGALGVSSDFPPINSP